MGRGSRKVGPFRRVTVSCSLFGTCTTAFPLPASPFEREDGAASDPAPGHRGPGRPGRRVRLEPRRPHALPQSEPDSPTRGHHYGRLHPVDHAVRVLRDVAYTDHVPHDRRGRGRDDASRRAVPARPQRLPLASRAGSGVREFCDPWRAGNDERPRRRRLRGAPTRLDTRDRRGSGPACGRLTWPGADGNAGPLPRPRPRQRRPRRRSRNLQRGRSHAEPPDAMTRFRPLPFAGAALLLVGHADVRPSSAAAPEAVRVRASAAFAPCLAPALEAAARAPRVPVVLTTADPDPSEDADLVVGDDVEMTRLLESGTAEVASAVDLGEIPWVTVVPEGAPHGSVSAFATEPVSVLGGRAGREARASLGSLRSEERRVGK